VVVMAAKAKVLSLRLPEDQAAELAAVARVDDVPVSEAIREAIAEHIVVRRADEGFQKRLRKQLEDERTILERFLADDSDQPEKPT
jgi:hypothetical protein